jgi:hypothetical protein
MAFITIGHFSRISNYAVGQRLSEGPEIVSDSTKIRGSKQPPSYRFLTPLKKFHRGTSDICSL